ncbi:hypothetical protein LSAT2_021560 [Lamellibrachia satsuma]|nr:hypothetical protein LSAT2_021560 [Lamellibrachia satsuma]
MQPLGTAGCIQRQCISVEVPNIDLSRAIDTIRRDNRLVTLSTFGESELRKIIFHLADTSFESRLSTVDYHAFTTTIDKPQADGLGPLLFTVEQEAAIKERVFRLRTLCAFWIEFVRILSTQ